MGGRKPKSVGVYNNKLFDSIMLLSKKEFNKSPRKQYINHLNHIIMIQLKYKIHVK